MTGKRPSAKAPSGVSLLGDIGGTHVRFALLARDRISQVAILDTADYSGPYPVMQAFLRKQAPGARIDHACLAIAGWVEKGRARLTNGGWSLDTAEMRRIFKFKSATLVNDFEAIAWSLPHLAPAELHYLGGPTRFPGRAPMAALGPGTGLGVGCLLPEGDSWRALASEGGHVSLAAGDGREAAVIEWLRGRYGHVSSERALSGDGLVNLYSAIGALDRRKLPLLSAPEIADAALGGRSAAAKAALDMFCALLGGIAGNLALTCGARGGVYIGGGIVPRFPDYITRSAFRRRFEEKGRLKHYLEVIPTAVILHPNPAMLGLAALLASQRGRGPARHGHPESNR
jgi:glucokinase